MRVREGRDNVAERGEREGGESGGDEWTEF